MGKPDAPTPPSPTATAAAQTSSNVQSAVANAYLNNVNQNTPDGSLNYAVSGNYGWTDPTTGQTYQIPTFTSTQTLTPQGQAIKDQTLGTQFNLAQMGNQQSARVGGLLSAPFNPNAGAPAAGNAQNILNVQGASTSYDPGGQIQSSIGNYGQQQTTFGDAGNITSSYGPDNFSTDRQNVQDALLTRMNPQLAIEKQGIQQQLADQGIRPGSDAYNAAMFSYGQQANDARYGAISQAGQEQQRMMDMAAQQAGFQNAAQQQAYTQAQGRGQFANDAQQNNYNQALGAGTFANAAQGQQNTQNAAAGAFNNAGLAQQVAQQQSGFNAQNSALNQYLQQQYQQRNQPLNEISALMSGSQLQQPNWLNSPTSQIPTTDFAGITNQNFQNQRGIYQQQNANYNATIGGILGLGAGVLKSDRDSKENIDRIGTVFAASSKSGKNEKLPIYEYSYKGDPASRRHTGPMAQDVERVTPEAVTEIGGVKHIRPAQVMGSILRAA